MSYLFRNFSIRAKALIASIVLLTCMAALGINAYHTISKTHTGLKSVSEITLPKQLAVSKLTDDIVATHVSIFRYVSWASNGVTQTLLDELGTKVFTGIDATTLGLMEFTERLDLEADEKERIQTLVKKWKQYEQVAKDTIDVGSVDAPMATMMLGMVDDEFKSVDEDLKAFFVSVTEQTQSIIGDVASQAGSNKRVLAIGGILAVVISLFVTLGVAKSIVRPIQSITNLMQQVSSGKLDVTIDDLSRRDEIGKMVRAVAAFRQTIEHDNKLLKAREEELHVKNTRFNAALRNMSQGLVMFGSDARVILFNQRYFDMYQLSPDHIQAGCSFTELLEYRRTAGRDLGDAGDADDFCASILSAIERGKTTSHFVQANDGRIMNVINRPMPEGGWVSTHEDITERRAAEEKIALMARQDSLTALSNRVTFLEGIDAALARLKAQKASFAVFVLDLDQFKAVNDSLGHPVGDALLKTVAQRLLKCVDQTDTVARLGGDEFAILQTTATDGPKQAANSLAEKLLATITAPYLIDDNEVIIGISIGIAMAPDDGDDADQLLKNADLALYKTKSDGRNDYRFFDPEMAAEMRSRHSLALDLRNSVTHQEIGLHYQTIADAMSLDVCSVEALARWNHPQRGTVSPEVFISLAEETGMISALGESLLRIACRDAADWPEHIKVAVNLSPVQFRSGNLMESITRALADARLAPHRLEIEITESVLLQQNSENLGLLHDLRRMGISVVLDDFGTGYSSLSYLQEFPFDKIKIDRSFVRDLQTRADCAAIVSAITGLGRALNTTTTAEGVETQVQFELLRAAGCDQIQGYLFARPCPLSELNLGLVESRPVREMGGSAA